MIPPAALFSQRFLAESPPSFWLPNAWTRITIRWSALPHHVHSDSRLATHGSLGRPGITTELFSPTPLCQSYPFSLYTRCQAITIQFHPAVFTARAGKARLLSACGAIHLVPPPPSYRRRRHISLIGLCCRLTAYPAGRGGIPAESFIRLYSIS